eukprot:gene18761-20652_t
MEDDIDDLLDEVESKYCCSGRRKQPEKKPSNGKTTKSNVADKKSQNKPRHDSELSEALKDILEDDGLEINLQKPRTNSLLATEKGCIKCFPIYLSKVLTTGRTEANTRSCDRLHCTSCDNKVVSFDNFLWYKDCDYLFFRNNYPDFDKMKVYLMPSRGSRAYCCQCHWMTVNDQIKISDHPEFKWICKGHH